MDKEKILAKLNAKDYNNELETILEEKNFSETVKNLLLSMLYKIEAGYPDYIVAKRVVQNRKDYIETILSIIKEKVNVIQIVEEESEIGKELVNKIFQYKIDKVERSIQILHPNEKNLLYALYQIDDTQVYLPEEYNLIRITLSEVLNMGENMNNIEVLRDFNGWSWNTIANEIPDIAINLIYQNLIYLLGIELIQEIIHTNEVIDIIKKMQEKLEQIYGEKNATALLEKIYALSILITTNTNEREKNRLQQEKEELNKELDRLNNKSELLNEVSNHKKEARKQIKEIDSILSNKKRLEEEYIKRNEKLPEYNKIFSLSHLTEILTRQRKKIVQGIEEANKILDPNYYVTVKTKLEQQIALLENMAETKQGFQIKKEQDMIDLQKIFLNCMEEKVKQVTQKEEILDLLYMLRYYNLLYINLEKQIKDIPVLRNKQEKILEALLEKGQIAKQIVKLSQDNSIDIALWNHIFKSRFINLENRYLIIKSQENGIELYDTDILEEMLPIALEDKKQIIVKPNKKIKLFI